MTMHCRPLLRFGATLLCVASCCGTAAAGAVTENWGGELRIDERQDNGVRQTFGGTGADDDRLYYLNGGADPANQVHLWPITEATATGELKALGLIGYHLPGWYSLRGRAWAESRIDDLLRVRVDGELPSGQLTLRMNIQVDGRFWGEINGLDPLSTLKLMDYQYYSAAYVYARWTSSNAIYGDQRDLFANSMHRLGAGGVGDAQLFQGMIPFVGDLFDSQTRLHSSSNRLVDDVSFSRDRTYTLEIPVEADESLGFSLALVAGTALTLENIDFYGVTGQVDAGFEHTASIASVELLDGSGRPFVGRWRIDSDLGIDYPEFIVTGTGAVPLPGTLVLALAGLWPAWRMRRMRRAPP